MRKLRLLATLVPLVALAFPAAAQLERFKDWDKSPEFTYYATEDEQAAWKAVKSDEEAQKFNNLFWGKRHPDYQKNAQNVFRCPVRRPRGQGRRALRAREAGREAIPAGGPDRAREGAHPPRAAQGDGLQGRCLPQDTPAGAGAEEGEGRFLGAGGGGTTILTRFQYEKEQLPEWSGVKIAPPHLHDGSDGADRVGRQARGREEASRRRPLRRRSSTRR